jgi:predicted nucleic acid-binding protein
LQQKPILQLADCAGLVKVTIGWSLRDRVVFIDSQGWIAIASTRDQDHQAASEVYKDLVEESWQFHTSNWTLYDADSHLKERSKMGGAVGAKYLRDLVLNSPAIRVSSIGIELEDDAVKLFWSLKDKQWSVTTCANVLLMRYLGIITVLSGNHHYQQAGFHRLYRSASKSS